MQLNVSMFEITHLQVKGGGARQSEISTQITDHISIALYAKLFQFRHFIFPKSDRGNGISITRCGPQPSCHLSWHFRTNPVSMQINSSIYGSGIVGDVQMICEAGDKAFFECSILQHLS